MTELKTLNETLIEDYQEMPFKDVKSILRQEAIKWVKQMSTHSEFCLDGCNNDKPFKHNHDDHNCLTQYDYETTDITGAIIWITHFFGITEDDLK